MSGSSTPASGPLTSAETVDLRRFCGYAPIVTPQTLDPLVDMIPQLTADHLAVIRTYLANLRLLEADLPGMRAQLGTAQAAVFTRNPAEQDERNRLYRDQRRALCLILGIPTGPYLGALIPAAFAV